MMMTPPKRKTLDYRFAEKHKSYIRACRDNTYNFAEGAVRSGKTVDHVFEFSYELKTAPDKIHIATGATLASAKLIIGDCNGFGLEHIFRGQCRWGKYKDNDALFIRGPATGYRERIVIFAGGGKADSYKKIRGSSYGMWIATEINLHHEKMIEECFARQLAAKKRKVFWDLNPCHPKDPIYTKYIDDYVRRAAKAFMKLLLVFLIFCLSHAKRATIPENARFVCDPALIGSDGEWEYLYGSTGWKITKALLDLKYDTYYSKHGWTREEFDRITKDWIGRIACDCNGLIDFFLGVDKNAQYNYATWCKGHNGTLTGHTVALGECVFVYSASKKKMTHVGYVCGIDVDGEPLVVEERGLAYGCVITRLCDRPWTHWGLPTAALDCSTTISLWEPETAHSGSQDATEPVVFACESPVMQGDSVTVLQAFLNAIGYRDADGNILDEDGKLGKKTWAALQDFVKAHSEPVPAPLPKRLDVTLDGETLLSATV